MALRGDFHKIEKLEATVEKIAAGELSKRSRRAAGEAAMAQLRLGFRKSRDPYGQAWAELAIRVGKPLRDRGILANSFTLTITPEGFRIGTPVHFAHVHQGGMTIEPRHANALRFKVRGVGWFTRKRVTIPARPMLPEGDLATWAEPIAEALGDAWVELWSKEGP